MKSSRLGVAALLWGSCLLVLAGGCVKKSQYKSVVAERDALLAERDQLAEVVVEQDQQLSALEADYKKLSVIFEEEIANKELQLQQLADGIEVAIPSDVMYESGSATATIGSDGIEYARRLAEFLKENDYFISVVGHTDNQKPTRALAKKYPTNWDLAGARAASAVNYFVSQGVDPTRMVASSRGEFDPIASNDTAEGRAQNRRIQIILRSLPK